MNVKQQPKECERVWIVSSSHPKGGYYSECPNIKCTHEDFDGASYRCDKCGYSYYFYY